MIERARGPQLQSQPERVAHMLHDHARAHSRSFAQKAARRHFLIALLLALEAASGGAATPAGMAIVVASKVVVEAPSRPVLFPGNIRAYQGVPYAIRPGYRPLALDVYVPPQARSGARMPLVIYIHGGGWQGGNPKLSGAMSDFPAVLASMARRGYVVASLSYRLSSEAQFPAAPADIRSGIRWLKDHAHQYGIDANKVGVWGASAGGQLAGLAATACTDPAFEDRQATASSTSPCVQAAVAWYGVFDFSTIAEQAGKIAGAPPHQNPNSGETRYLGCRLHECSPELLKLASPISHVDRRDPPMLLIAGTADHTVPPAQSKTMSDALEKAGVEHRLLLIPGVDHSFIGRTPAETRTATITALDATFSFFDRILRGR